MCVVQGDVHMIEMYFLVRLRENLSSAGKLEFAVYSWMMCSICVQKSTRLAVHPQEKPH
jgi:hypothetical protein